MKTPSKKLLVVLALGTLVQSALAAPVPADLPRGAVKRPLSAAEVASYREQAARFRTTAPPRAAGASLDPATVVVVTVVCVAAAAVAASGMSNSIVIKP